MMPGQLPTVHIVDDAELLRSSLQTLVETNGLRALTYCDAQEFLNRYEAAEVECLLLDISMPGMSGLELQEQLNERESQLPIIILTGNADVPSAVRAMKQGALDFVEKPFDGKILMNSVRRALESCTRKNQVHLRKEEYRQLRDSLSRREKEIVELLIQGKSNKVIGHILNISARTVEVHRANIKEKLGVDSISEIVRICLLADGEIEK